MKKVIVMLIVVVLTACGDDNEVKDVELGQEFSLNEGDAALVSDSDIRLDVNDLSDSRCPEGVQCFWEGEAKVSFSFEVAGNDVLMDSLSLSLNSFFNRPVVEIGDFTIELIDVTPYPEAGRRARNKEAKLVIRRN